MLYSYVVKPCKWDKKNVVVICESYVRITIQKSR